ncbi:hypothetical protein [Idiomarina abyssalis]|uniref:hypothetical protein n=1 Tax=Idiomarina abyssalis TaxID=86102 RepID=UPI003A8EBB69
MKITANQPVNVITDICCDACGATVVPEFQKEHRENLDGFNEFGVLHASYGYGSDQDGDSFHFDLCETCFKELLDRVKSLRAFHGLNS